jgi:hypothetical protein
MDRTDALVAKHLHLVGEAVKRCRRQVRPQDLDDIRSDAQLSLVQAARRFRGEESAVAIAFPASTGRKSGSIVSGKSRWTACRKMFLSPTIRA